MSAADGAASWKDRFLERAGDFRGELKVDEPLARHTYYRIGGPAALMAQPTSLEDLAWLAERLKETRAPFAVIGAGSNLLVADVGFEGLIVRTQGMNSEITRADVLRSGAGVPLATLLRRCGEEGWGGLEFLAGIPGCVGGAVVMNAGAWDGKVGDVAEAIEFVPLAGEGAGIPVRISREGIHYRYRGQGFIPPGAVVWAAEWRVSDAEPAAVKAKLDTAHDYRRKNHPLEYPSCGSVFKNPDGGKAWDVVERLGLRGHTVGRARISEKHTNFIVNLGGAKASDVKALIDLVKRRAWDDLGVRLEEEVVLLGF